MSRPLLAASLALALAPLPAAAEDKPEFDTRPDWRRRPGAAEVAAAYPKTLRGGEGGKATIACEVSIDGVLVNCRVDSEEPAGQGWGAAALALAPQFLMHPATRDGKPVAGAVVRIPIEWHDPPARTVNSRRVTLFARPAWEATPTRAEVLAAYPQKARAQAAEGDVVLRCKVGGDQRMSECLKVMEGPRGLGFAGAARKLAPRFRMPRVAASGEPTAGGWTDLRFRFDLAALGDADAPATVSWTRTAPAEALAAPEAARRAGVTRGRVDLACRAGADGRMEDCEVRAETPAGLGFAAAALALSDRYAVNLWSEEGLPTAGSPVRFPVVFGGPDEAP